MHVQVNDFLVNHDFVHTIAHAWALCSLTRARRRRVILVGVCVFLCVCVCVTM